MKTINQRLQELYNTISSPDFVSSKGLGNEIDFHVFDYDPADEYIVRDYLINYLTKKQELKLKVINIYDLIIEILKEKGFLEKVFDYEKEKGSKYVNSIIVKTLSLGLNSDLIVNKIKENIMPNEIIIITGIGNAWPIVRGHTVLNNLHSIIRNNPLIMFYPGMYNGRSFSLFNKIDSDNYYRAFQIVSRK